MAYFKDDIAPKTAAYETPRIYIQFKDEAFNNLENDRGFYPFQFCNNPDFSFYHTGEPFHWGHAYFYLKNRKHAKYAILGIWNGAQDKWYMDDLKIEAFN